MRWKLLLGVWCQLGVLGCVGSLAQATPDMAAVRARLDEVARSYTPHDAFMGAVLVADGDQVLLDKGYGMAVVEWGIPNAPEVKFRLGSLTKQFTATLVLLLQQDGKLKIDDPVSKYLPDAPKAWEKITLAELMGHTSGIQNFTSFKEFRTWAASAHTSEEELAFFRDKPLDFEPGSQFAYSNSNYEVLGVVIEKVSGKKYREMLRERIFDPLGMKDTGLDEDELVLPKRAEGYVPGHAGSGQDGLVILRAESMTVPWAAGALYSTTGDLLKWERGLFGEKVLSAESLKRMTTPGKGGYALGLEVRTEDGTQVVSHGGGIEGFNTRLTYLPEKKIAVVVLSNVNGAAPDRMGNQLLQVALGKTVVLDNERKAVPIAKEELAKFVGEYAMSPTFSVTFAVEGDTLTGRGSGEQPMPMIYLGLVQGHPRFYVTGIGAEIEFVPDAGGAYTSIITHVAGHDTEGKKK